MATSILARSAVFLVWGLHLCIPILGLLLVGLRNERQRIAAERAHLSRLLVIARGRRR